METITDAIPKVGIDNNSNERKILFIEPYYGGSHKALIDTLVGAFKCSSLVTLSAKKWHWRARCGALMLCNLIPKITTEEILFCSSVLNLAELLGIRPDLQPLRKVVYFHENQIIYPVQKIKERDIQYAYNQINTCLAADVIVFNSNFNKTSFLDNLAKIIKLFPDNRPERLRYQIENKCRVLYFPVVFPQSVIEQKTRPSVLHILWPHRWEFDKGPEDFFSVLLKLKNNGFAFKVSILGEGYAKNPDIFAKAKAELYNEINHFGFVENKDEYFKILNSSHVVVSTAKHEFFGVSMLEATFCGCFPLAPNSLVYPEIYPAQCLYFDLNDLYNKLKEFCQEPSTIVEAKENLNIDFSKYSSTTLIPKYLQLFQDVDK